TIAGLSDPGAGATASIDWGDGQTTGAVLGADPGNTGRVLVSGTHTYARWGSYVIAAQVSAASGGTTYVYATASVADAPLTATAGGFHVVRGGTFDGVVAAFPDANPSSTAADLRATIDWGDGHTSTGIVAGDGQNGFVVRDGAAHRYANAGNYGY